MTDLNHEIALLPGSSATLAELSRRDADRVISRVFYRLSAAFGAQIDNRLLGDDTKAAVIIAEWRHRLSDLPIPWIERGFNRLHDRPASDRRYAPGVIEFVDLCLPSAADLGIPEKLAAHDEAKRRAYSHPMVAVVAQRVGVERLRGERWEQARREFGIEYDQALDQARRGHVFDWPSNIVPPHKRAARDRQIEARNARAETVSENVAEIHETLRGSA